jgi:DNA-binding beta-propeller fold protein YncE
VGVKAVRMFGAVAAVALIGGIGWMGWRASGARQESTVGALSSSDHSLAAVLVPGANRRASVVVVDLDTLRVVRRVRLRSTASEIALDATSGLIVTAQCGGVGSGADDAAGIVNPRTGAVSYVHLERPNPDSVVAMGGRAYVMHGWTDAGHAGTFFLSVVDPVSGTLERSGLVPETSSLWRGGAGRLWTTGRADSGDDWRLITVSPADLSTAVVGDDGKSIISVIDGGASLYLLSTRLPTEETTSGRVIELDPTTLEVRRTADLSGLRYGAIRGAVTPKRMAVIDDIGEERPSRAITLVDRSDLGVVRTVKVPGIPAAVAAWGERFVLVDREGGKLLVLDAGSGRVTGIVDLGETDLVWTDVEVLPAGPGVSEL